MINTLAVIQFANHLRDLDFFRDFDISIDSSFDDQIKEKSYIRIIITLRKVS